MTRKCCKREGFGEDVGMIIVRGNLVDLHNFVSPQIDNANVSLCHPKMFGRSMVDLLGTLIIGSLVVGIQSSGRMLGLAEVIQQQANVLNIPTSSSQGIRL